MQLQPLRAIDPARTAVIVVDVQRAFTDLLPFPLEPALADVMPRMSRFVDEARGAGATIVRVRVAMAKDDAMKVYDPFGELMLSLLEPTSPGVDFDPGIALHDSDIQLTKPRYSAFVRTELDTTLRGRGIDTVVLLGLTTNVCVQSTARDAYQLDYETITLADCCSEGSGAPFPLMNHAAAMQSIARNFGLVHTSDEVIAAWKTPIAAG